MSKMPNKFTEIWMLRVGDNQFEEICRKTGVSIYNQSYKGRVGSIQDGRLVVCYEIKEEKDKRVLYSVPINHDLAKGLKRAKCRVRWNDGEEKDFWCEPEKYMEGKKCETEYGTSFIFLSKKEVPLQTYLEVVPPDSGGIITCKI